MNTKKNSFEQGALILIITGIVSKTMGALYRIPLTNILGVEGIGLYQIVLSLLLLALALSSSFIPATISKCIGYLSLYEDRKQEQRVVSCQIIITIIVTTLISLLIIVFSKFIARYQHNESLRFSYCILIPTIVLSGIKSVFKGLFLGSRKMLIPSISQLLEEVFKIASSLSFAYFGAKKNVYFAVNGALFGLIFGEIAGLIFLYISKRINFKNNNKDYYSKLSYIKMLFYESFPIMISSIVFPIVTFIDSILIVKLLILSGNDVKIAVSQYGLLQGPTYSLIHLPIMMATSVSLAIVPVLSSLYSIGNVQNIKEKSSQSLKICLSLVIPAMLGLLILVRPIVEVLYPKISAADVSLCVSLFSVSCVNIILLSTYEVFSSIMQGLNKSSFVMKTTIVCVFLKLILEIIMIRFIGIYGAIVSNIFMYFVAFMACLIKYRQLLGKNIPLVQNISKIILSSGIMTIAVYLLINFIKNNLIKICIGIFLGMLTYAIMLLLFKVYSIREIRHTLQSKWSKNI